MTDLIMPRLGETVTEGTVVKWLKKEGDQIKKDEMIVEISTDKVDTEIPAPATGRLVKILRQEGETVPVNTKLAEIEMVKEKEAVTPKIKKPAAEAVTEKGAALPPEKPKKLVVTPIVRKLATQYGVDLNQIQGTGASGRITKQDVLNFVAKTEKAAKPIPPKVKPEAISLDKEEVRPLSLMRKTIAARMVASQQTAAHVTAVIEVNMDNVEQVRTTFKEGFKKQEGFSLTYLPFVCQAVISGLKQFPVLNSSLNEDKLIIKHYVNLGIAVALEDGLIVPVIKSADELSLLGLARKIKDVADRARAHKLLPDEVHEGTFTITNPGVFGTVIQTPIINPPQVGILSLEAVKKRVVVIDEAIAIKPMVNLCLSYDHRVLDGATAAQFLTYVKNELEQRDFKTEFS